MHINMHAVDAAGRSALQYAVSEGHTQVASALRVRAREVTQDQVREERVRTARKLSGY